MFHVQRFEYMQINIFKYNRKMFAYGQMHVFMKERKSEEEREFLKNQERSIIKKQTKKKPLSFGRK